ncbi:MAG: glutamyl-tRNA reductase [Saprospiraceae bacterium]|nr:glutamyl-tRNA reductase [Saprospiraceae bacterium]
MLDGYHVLTLTHRDATLETIGKVVVDGDATYLLHQLKDRFAWEEMLYLATCNRVVFLFYAQGPVAENTASEIVSMIRPDLSDAETTGIGAQMRMLHGADAIRHWMEVAASMDSLVIGEREIIRQLREAYDHNYKAGLTGDHLRLLTRFTIETAKEIYSQTGIGEKAVSVVALAFGEMLKATSDRNSRILLVGAGQTNTLFAKFLAKYGFNNITVFNRSLENAQTLAATLQGRALPLDALQHYSEGFDCLVVCTGATHAVITPEIYHNLLQGETSKKIVVDLSVPNNVDKHILSTAPVHFIEIEGLKSIASENLAYRENERKKAEIMITDRLYTFRGQWHERQVERSMSHIPDEVRAVKERAINQVYGKEFSALDTKTQALIMEMMGYMEKKCVAIPIKAVKEIAKKQLERKQRVVNRES